MYDIALKIAPYAMLFAAFSVIGWLMEVVLKYIQYRRFINRGYLIGPYCPIYGWGVLLITLLAGGVFYRKCTPMETFFVGFTACGALEYFISWYMEKTSHARWWDYSKKPLNLNGRIWIGNLTLFGIAAVAVVYLFDPLVFAVTDRIPDTALIISAGAFLVIMWADRCVSHFMVRIVKNFIDSQDADNTEEIRVEMRRVLKDRELLVRRIALAYPELQPRPGRLVEKLKRAKAEYHKTARLMRREVNRLERATSDMRKQLSQDILTAMRERVNQAKDAEMRTRGKLREIENDIFNLNK